MDRVRFFHLSRALLPPGTVLEPRGYPFVSAGAEAALKRVIPADCIARELSVYMSENPDRKKLGVKYSGGYLHIVEATLPTKRHDLTWTGELQYRHPKVVRPAPPPGSIDAQIAAKLSRPDPALAHLSDDEIARNYWLGAASAMPQWEVVSTSATVISEAAPDVTKL